MIRIQHLPDDSKLSLVRIYTSPNPAEMEPYQMGCVLVWETPTTVWVKLLVGVGGNRKLWVEFVEALAAEGVEKIKAYREEGRTLPRASFNEEGGYYEIDLTKI